MGSAPWWLADWWLEETNFVAKQGWLEQKGFPFRRRLKCCPSTSTAPTMCVAWAITTVPGWRPWRAVRAKPIWIPKQDDTWIRKILWGQATDKSQGKNIMFEELQRFSNPKGVDVTYGMHRLKDQFLVAHGAFPAITYFDMLYVGRTWMTRIYIYIYTMFVGHFFLSSSLCCNSLSGVFCSWKPKVTRCGRSMLRSYVYWPNVSKRRRPADCWTSGEVGGYWMFVDGPWTTVTTKSRDEQMKVSLDGLVLWMFYPPWN